MIALTTKGVEFATYLYLYNNYRIYPLPEDSMWVWILCLLGVDLGYYWFHRMAHEINLLWASHSVHHSSEDYNLSTALRQSSVQVYLSWVFYLPLAFFIPPPLFYFHKQLNALYQFYIHTQLIHKMGFLEYILNTPSHHRVHHGRNPKYIDKNYAGIFIIWDRMFGTFQEELEEPVYGLVHPLQTWNPLEGQIAHFKYVFQRVREEKSWSSKLATLWKGPGWHEGTPRLGLLEEIPEVDVATAQKYNPHVPWSDSIYTILHFSMVIAFSMFLLSHRFQSYILHSIITFFMVFSLMCFGAIFDQKKYAYPMELGRIVLLIVAEIFCWIAYRDEFIFLWYKDPLFQHIPLQLIKFIRGIFICSGVWMAIKCGVFSSSNKRDSDVYGNGMILGHSWLSKKKV